MTGTESIRTTIGALISGVMIALGAFIIGRLLVRQGDPLTPSPMLDLAFGVFVIGRGAVYFWTVRRRSRP